MTKISTKEFSKLLRERMLEIGEEQGWEVDSAPYSGYAFQLWAAETITDYDQGMETEPVESLLISKDLKADIVLEDSIRKHMIIGQCKFSSLSKRRPIDETEVNDFFNRHAHFMDRKWVRSHGSEHAFELLGDYADRIADGWNINYYFLSTGDASPRVSELVDRQNAEYAQNDASINCRLYDFSALKDFYTRSKSLEASIPDEVRIDLQVGKFFERIDKKRGYKTIVTVLKGNSLRNLYKQHKEALIAFNIRSYLGDRGINAGIKSTAENNPNDFFYFNNGISAICTDYKLDGAHLIAKKFQVINGAQTLGALAQARESPDVEVLVRITKTLDVATEKGLNEKIIRFNNSQNVIKVSDFRSNDEIQQWLEKKFDDFKPGKNGALGKMKYIRRRGTKKGGRGTGRGFKLEDLGKVRYSYLYEPMLTQSSPVDLWTSKKAGGSYEKAFGVDGELAPLWSEEEFESLLLALAFFFKCQEKLKGIAKSRKELASISRLKFHVVALAGDFVRGKDDLDVSQVIRSKAAFDKLWGEFWSSAFNAISTVYRTAIQKEDSTVFALVRSGERWKEIRGHYQDFVLGASE